MTVSFSIEGYRGLVKRLLQDGYSVVGYDSVDGRSRHLILRHDVDFCLRSAIDLAEVERELGVAAHYFVQTRSEFYNPLTRSARDAFASLRKLGHHIGLHFDPSGHSSSPALANAVAADAALLADLSCGPVDAVSFHRPAREYLAGAEKLGGVWNAYARRFIEDIGYCSDSQGAWRFGHPFENSSVEQGRALQLLTHPIWWISEAGEPVEKLQRFLSGRGEMLANEMAANSIPFKQYLSR